MRRPAGFGLPFAAVRVFFPGVARLKLKLIWRVACLLPIPLVWCFLSQTGQLVFLENKLADLRFRFRGEISAPVKVVYVDVDTRAIEAMGEKPWSRALFADVINAVFAAGEAKAVGVDIVFSKVSNSKLVDAAKTREGNIALRKAMLAHPKKVVLAAQYTQGATVTQQEGSIRDVPLLRKGKSDRTKNDVPEMPDNGFVIGPQGKPVGRVGLIDVDVEYSVDTVPRWVPLFAHSSGPTLYHFSLQLVLEYLGLDESAVRIGANTLELVEKNGEVALSIPLREGQLLESNWFSRWDNPQLNPRVSVADVFDAISASGSADQDQRKLAAEFFGRFKGALVLIGPTDSLLQDLAPTPFDSQPVPKVGLHGNLVKTMLSEQFIQRPPNWVMWAASLGLTLFASSLATSGHTRNLSLLSKAFALVTLVGYAFVAFYLFSRSQIMLPMAAPLGAALSTSFVAILWQLIDEEKQKGRIKGMFGAYLAPALVDKMVDSGEDPQLGGVEENITAYFSDIQAFSSFSEKLTPQGLVGLMNEYLTACTDIVQAEGGTLDKYIGDAVVAIYGAPLALPDNGYRACVAALRVHARIAELREKWRHETEKNWPEIVLNLQTRIGLNTGLAVVGNMGSTSRFSYTMMGDNVNLAARMESGAKAWGVYSMCSEATKLECEKHGGDRVVFRPLGRIVVKGRTKAVPIYEIAALRETVTPDALECYRIFTDGLNRYYERDWDGALARFEQSKELEPNQPGKTPGVTSNPSLVYLGITEHAKHEPPPENWGGVYVMKEK